MATVTVSGGVFDNECGNKSHQHQCVVEVMIKRKKWDQWFQDIYDKTRLLQGFGSHRALMTTHTS